MKTKLLLLFMALAFNRPAFGQGTSFNYQGRLTEANNPANGSYDLTFSLFSVISGGSPVTASLTNSATTVSNGLFTVALDFGANFPGADRWLEIALRTNGSSTFTLLAPRQKITASPYAITAGNVTGPIDGSSIVNGTVTDAQLGKGAAVANLSASGQSGVASGGMILSGNFNDANLGSAGYLKIGKVDLGDVWEERASANRPAARDTHTAVWTGTEMIVWGGIGSGILDDGGLYDPALDLWRNLKTNLAPAGRYEHRAVWTGSEMIVWGGFTGASYDSLVNSGGRYHPVNNSWTTMSTNNAPSPRAFFTAVWTGNEMIVWGGYDGTNHLSNGARYSPTLDSWSPVTNNSAPSARYNHTAVWTGSEMIIWGGINAGIGPVNTGAHYRPSFDSWAAMLTNNSPGALTEHTAVWTGTEMLVWGGSAPTTLGTKGGRYNPSPGFWRAMATNGMPSPRSLHSAVWTGTEMIVWGGDNSATIFNDGGRYRPDFNSWIPVMLNGAPAGRRNHTAVWTGSEMVVWGGFAFTVDASIPYSYVPSRVMYLYLRQ